LPRRRALFALCAALAARQGAALAQGGAADARAGHVPPPHRWPGHDPYPPYYGWEPPRIDGCAVLFVDDVPLMLDDVEPAAGPLARFTSRPGAWYAAVFVPLRPGVPVQLWLWQRARTHALHLLALDAPPRGAPTVATPLPLRTAAGAGRGSAQHSLAFALPARSGADGVYVLVELWSVAGDRPGPVWLQARSRLVRERERAPWWSPRTDPEGPLAPEPPLSPLQSSRLSEGVIELPILQRAGAAVPRFDPWGPR